MRRVTGIITMLCSLFGCSAQTEGFKSLSVEEYAKAIEDTTIVRLDVRTAEEYADGHIGKALNIDVLKSDFEQKAVATLPKDRIIAINCRSGKRSISQTEGANPACVRAGCTHSIFQRIGSKRGA